MWQHDYETNLTIVAFVCTLCVLNDFWLRFTIILIKLKEEYLL